MIGNDGDNDFDAGGGNDLLLGNGGNDEFDMSTGATSSPGNDTIDGGAGFDTLDYDGYAKSAIRVTFSAPGNAGIIKGAATAERKRGVLQHRTCHRRGFNDLLGSYTGNDYVDGRGGDDTLSGSSGN